MRAEIREELHEDENTFYAHCMHIAFGLDGEISIKVLSIFIFMVEAFMWEFVKPNR